MSIVEALGCPVIGTMAGRATVPIDHPNFLYSYSAGADLARRESDVILVAGSRVGNLDIPYDKYWGDGTLQKVIQIDVDGRHIGVTRPLALGIVADVNDALEGLARILASRRPRRRGGPWACITRPGASPSR